MRHFLIALSLFAPVAALADTVADVAALVVALEAEDCLFTADNGAGIAEAAGLDQDRLLVAINELVLQNLVSVTANGEMKLESEACN